MIDTRVARLALFLALAASPAAAQFPTVADPAEVMVLGTYHFANPGLDVVQVEIADVLSPAKQAEIERIVDAIARFRPTVVAVEAQPSQRAALDSLFAAYRAGRHELDRNEVQQLGFRLADRFGLSGVEPIDHDGEFPFGPLMEYAAQKDSAALRYVQEVFAQVQAEHQRRHRELTIPEILRLDNDPSLIAQGHGVYVRINEVGAGDGYAGADVLSAWYERNVRIFANVQRLASADDRVLVIIGSGHAAILRELVKHDPEMVLVDALDYLPE